MQFDKKSLRILDLSKNEYAVLNAIHKDIGTPVALAQKTKLTRQTIYNTLARLKRRTLIKQQTHLGKKQWVPVHAVHIHNELHQTKKQLLHLENSAKERYVSGDASVVVYKGAENIRTLLRQVLESHPGQLHYSVMGFDENNGWFKVFNEEATHEINRLVKENNILTHVVVPKGFYERESHKLGEEWARNFEGRSTAAYEIDEQYFAHGGQMWLFNRCLYLASMHEELLIAIHDSEIQKMILSMFECMKNSGEKVDVNEILRQYIEKDAA